jgi:hypothetical protein
LDICVKDSGFKSGIVNNRWNTRVSDNHLMMKWWLVFTLMVDKPVGELAELHVHKEDIRGLAVITDRITSSLALQTWLCTGYYYFYFTSEKILR